MTKSKLLRMHNVGIVVKSLDDAISFFTELGLTLEGRAMVEGEWAGRVTGVGNQCVEIAMMVTPDGHSRLELSRFLAPSVVADHRNAPVNALGYLRAMFAVVDIDGTLARLEKRGAKLVGKVVNYQDTYRLCYVRGPKESSSGSRRNSNSTRSTECDRFGIPSTSRWTGASITWPGSSRTKKCTVTTPGASPRPMHSFLVG